MVKSALSNDFVHALTFDVEDWYQGYIHRGIEGWENLGSREDQNVEILLKILDDYNTKATFFVLGRFARGHGDLVKLISFHGHEIATHGYAHVPVANQSRQSFRDDLRRSLNTLSDLLGKKVLGHRAARWSISQETLWALDILAEEGLQYDSSVFPTNFHPYGLQKSPLHPYRLQLSSGGSICEFPAQIFKIGPLRIPAAGGFYFRALPYRFTERALKQSERKGQSGMVYLHPYDLDPDPPRIKSGLFFRFMRHYHLERTKPFLKTLLDQFRFNSAANILDQSGLTFPVHTIPFR